jgi:hypothetical protein
MPDTSRMSRRVLLAMAAGAAAQRLQARNSEFWQTKDRSRWSEREIDRLLTKSPWAKEITADVPVTSRAQPQAGGATAWQSPGGGIPGLGGGIGGIRLPGAGIPGLGGERGRTSGGRAASKMTCIVRWESAAPILDALATELPGAFADHYAIGVSGLPSNSADLEDSAFDQLIAKLKESTSLRVSGRPRVRPDLVQLVPGVTSRGFLFGFLKEDLPLAIADKSVEFRTGVDGVRLTATYELAAMIYRGQLAV